MLKISKYSATAPRKAIRLSHVRLLRYASLLTSLKTVAKHLRFRCFLSFSSATRILTKITPIILTIILTAASALGADHPDKNSTKIGQVIALRGIVTASTSNGTPRALKIKDPLYHSDTIHTDRRGRIQMLFNDSTIISLGRGTEMNLTEYAWDNQQKTGRMTTTVKQGTFRIMGGAITKYSPKTFKTITPSATIGIRGSMYSGNITGTKLTVVFQGGTGIDVTNGAGTVAISTPGFGTYVESPQHTPNEPVLFSAADMEGINDSMTSDTEQEQDTSPQDGDAEQGDEPQDGNDESPPSDSSEPAESNTTEDEPTTEEQPPPPPTDTPPVTDSSTLVNDVTETTSTASRPLENIGATTPAIPTDGISAYKGQLSGTNSSTGTITGNAFMEANWHNKKAFGIMGDPADPKGMPVFFFGSINGTSLTNVKIFGSQADATGLSALEGQGDGLFYGQDYGLFTLDALGNDYDLTDTVTTVLSDWTVSASLSKDTVQDPADKTSPTGSELWEGFFVGIAENVNDIDNKRQRFANTSSSNFSFTVNKDTGTISGSMSSTSLTGSGSINSIQIGEAGGSGNSAYILDDAFAAILECSSGNCIDGSNLKKVGNYLFTPEQDEKFSSWATWGYWEAAYQGSPSEQYHAHVPGTLWIAGVTTPSSAISNLISTNFAGTYNGMARATMFDTNTSPDTFQYLSGLSQWFFDFNNVASIPISGTLDFGTAGVYDITSSPGAISVNGFSANITTGSNLRTSAIEGVFYGSNAQAIGGNFAFDDGSKQFTGIFGASR